MGVEDSIVQHENLKIDENFVVPREHRPKHPHNSYIHNTDRIPLIDLSPLQHSPPDAGSIEKLVDEVGDACEQWGFFQVINHGLPLSLLEMVKKEAGAFFALPLEEKRKMRRTFENALGYNDTELTKNVRDWKEVFDFTVSGTLELPARFDDGDEGTRIFSNKWPSHPPGLRDACERYSAAVEKLAFSLLELVSQSLGLPPKFFNEYFKQGTSFMRLNHYPICPAPELALGVSRHKDTGALTVLAQDEVGGLEVRRKDGEWIGVKPDPTAFVINVGDLIQVWSNDRYQSVEHRVVVNENKDRFSIPLFFNPAHWVDVSPVTELLDKHHSPRYKPINWGKYYKRRKDSNFKNLGVENLQIYDFAING